MFFRLYGDEGELKFWSITLHYLRREKCRKACPAHKVRFKLVSNGVLDFCVPNLNDELCATEKRRVNPLIK